MGRARIICSAPLERSFETEAAARTRRAKTPPDSSDSARPVAAVWAAPMRAKTASAITIPIEPNFCRRYRRIISFTTPSRRVRLAEELLEIGRGARLEDRDSGGDERLNGA